MLFGCIHHWQYTLQPKPEDTTTELDPKYKVTPLHASQYPAQQSYRDEQQEAVAAAYAFSQLEASLSGTCSRGSSPQSVSMQGMTASTSGTTGAAQPGQSCPPFTVWCGCMTDAGPSNLQSESLVKPAHLQRIHKVL